MPLHPFLFIVSPLVFLYAHNVNEILTLENFWRDLIVGIFLLLCLNAICLKIGSKFLSKTKTAILLSLFWISIFSPVDIEQLLGFRVRYVILGLILVNMSAVFWVLKTKSRLIKIENFLNIVSIFLVFANLSQILTSYVKFKNQGVIQAKKIIEYKNESKSSLPDIYYFIFDQYGNEKTLKSYGFDNRYFIQELKKNGFILPTKSHSNFAFTRLSIPSTFQADYLEEIIKKEGKSSKDLNWPISTLLKSEVARQFKQLGYQYITFTSTASSIQPLERNPNSDLIIDCGFENSLQQLLIKKTILNYFPLYWKYRHSYRRKNFLCKFNLLKNVMNIGGPKFVFNYFLFPHPPWILNSNGEAVDLPNGIDYESLNSAQNIQQYLGQVEYLNRNILHSIKEILAHSSSPPIIILQSDHGPNYSEGWMTKKTRQSPDRDKLNEVFGILNAYYVPKEIQPHLYDTITPVNTFRLLWKYYFHLKTELLPDYSYYSDAENSPYDIKEVSSSLD